MKCKDPAVGSWNFFEKFVYLAGGVVGDSHVNCYQFLGFSSTLRLTRYETYLLADRSCENTSMRYCKRGLTISLAVYSVFWQRWKFLDIITPTPSFRKFIILSFSLQNSLLVYQIFIILYLNVFSPIFSPGIFPYCVLMLRPISSSEEVHSFDRA